jgi:hypothetical protein
MPSQYRYNESMTDDDQASTETGIFEQLVKEQIPELFCDNCGYYPIEPVHGHFMCPSCHMPTKCCEGMPIET